ncbi:3-dehydroquinate synthase [Acidovorax sp. LjRoot117]|uniref:3-dehydroquinate synthase n=1 Tax=Acidovorax sp. LjRoot117 TaxID=3342255 RepID=UPI003ED16C66
MIERVPVLLEKSGYEILIGADIFSQISLKSLLGSVSDCVIVTNETIAALHLDNLRNRLAGHGSGVKIIILPDGESYKNTESLWRIYDSLISWACDRKTVLFALGGGVVGDIAGFAAATYMRGIPFVQIPTTLLAQVDSSVGGKTAINHPQGKNMIGAFHQPKLVICDLSTLDTLPPREMSAGLAEVIKYGPIADMSFMKWLENSVEAVLGKDRKALAYAVRRSCEIKAGVVGQDEKESGLRAILNFGHTFGHAIEAGLGYGVWLHGEGVGVGMVMAAELSCRLGLVDRSFVERLTSLITRAMLPTIGPIIDANDNAGRYLELMRVDKKSEAGEIRFVVIDGPGNATLRTAPDALVREVIDACCEPRS